MNRSFYLWLLISLLANSVMFAVMKHHLLTAMVIPGDKPAIMDVFMVAPATPEEQPLDVILARPIPAPAQPFDPALPASDQPSAGLRHSPFIGSTGAIGTTHPNNLPAPPGQAPGAAPAMMTSPTGQDTVPVGSDHGIGSQPVGADTPDAGGRSYGATVQGHKSLPRYDTKTADNLHEEATVVVSVSIDATGHVTDVQLSRRSPYTDLNAAALRAARAVHYIPAMQHGMPAASSDTTTYIFHGGIPTVQ